MIRSTLVLTDALRVVQGKEAKEAMEESGGEMAKAKGGGEPSSKADGKEGGDKKDDDGWRGPADLLELDKLNGTGTVRWQGLPYLVPLRHIRESRFLFSKVVADIYATLESTNIEDEDSSALMDLCDGVADCKALVAGTVINRK